MEWILEAGFTAVCLTDQRSALHADYSNRNGNQACLRSGLTHRHVVACIKRSHICCRCRPTTDCVLGCLYCRPVSCEYCYCFSKLLADNSSQLGFHLGRPFRTNMDDVTVGKPFEISSHQTPEWVPYVNSVSTSKHFDNQRYSGIVSQHLVSLCDIMAPCGYVL